MKRVTQKSYAPGTNTGVAGYTVAATPTVAYFILASSFAEEA
jgi:hypothetical protein